MDAFLSRDPANREKLKRSQDQKKSKEEVDKKVIKLWTIPNLDFKIKFNFFNLIKKIYIKNDTLLNANKSERSYSSCKMV